MTDIFDSWLFRVLFVFAGLGMFVTNCGFQGPLYLPKKPVASATAKKASSSVAKAVSSAPKVTTSSPQAVIGVHGS